MRLMKVDLGNMCNSLLLWSQLEVSRVSSLFLLVFFPHKPLVHCGATWGMKWLHSMTARWASCLWSGLPLSAPSPPAHISQADEETCSEDDIQPSSSWGPPQRRRCMVITESPWSHPLVLIFSLLFAFLVTFSLPFFSSKHSFGVSKSSHLGISCRILGESSILEKGAVKLVDTSLTWSCEE